MKHSSTLVLLAAAAGMALTGWWSSQAASVQAEGYANEGRYVLLPATLTVRRGSSWVEEQTVLSFDRQNGKAWRYVENVNDEGQINRRWFPVETVDR